MGVILTEKKKRKDVQIPRKYFRIVRDMGIVLAKYFEDTEKVEFRHAPSVYGFPA